MRIGDLNLTRAMLEALFDLATRGASCPSFTGLPKSTFLALERRGLAARTNSGLYWNITDFGRVALDDVDDRVKRRRF
jgi:hypothetical protein